MYHFLLPIRIVTPLIFPELVNMGTVCKDDLPIVDVMFHKMADLIFGAQQGKHADIHELNRFVVCSNYFTKILT